MTALRAASAPRVVPCRPLVAGEVVELPETGERFEVLRVTPCSATVRALSAEPRLVTIRDDSGEVVRQFTARSGGAHQEWSPRSIVRVMARGSSRASSGIP